MEKDGIPWNERAAAVGRSAVGGDESATLLFEGTLLEVAASLSKWRKKDLHGVRISLPDRHVAPRSFQGEALIEVVERSKIMVLRYHFGVSA